MRGLLLLDTNILVQVVRGNDIGVWTEHEYRLTQRSERPLLSTVVEAETRALAVRLNWGEAKLEHLGQLLSEFVRVEIDRPPIIDSYVELYCVAHESGHAIWQKNQNDLWLAATAHATGATLLTMDRDFHFLHPEHIRVEIVPKSLP